MKKIIIINEEINKIFKNEISLLESIYNMASNPDFFPKYYGYIRYISDFKLENYCIYFENCGMNLAQKLKKKDYKPFPIEEAFQVFGDVLKGLAFLESKNIWHRDVKLENIYFWEAKQKYILGDFGIAEKGKNITVISVKGTQYTLAPELRDKSFTQNECPWKTDVFSFGITILKLMAPSYNFNSNNVEELMNEVRKCTLELEEKSPKHHKLVEILKKFCLSRDPSERKTFVGIFMEIGMESFNSNSTEQIVINKMRFHIYLEGVGEEKLRRLSRKNLYKKETLDLGISCDWGNIGSQFQSDAADSFKEKLKDFFSFFQQKQKPLLEKVDSNSIVLQGLMYAHGIGCLSNLIKAFEYFNQAESMGNPYAMNLLGLLYYHGKGCKLDYTKAFEYFNNVVDELEGNYYSSCAIDKLGDCYYYGRGCCKDARKAFELYSKASKMNHANSINNLGMCYKNGEGCDKIDFNEAFHLFSKATEMNNPNAINNLGDCYYYGEGPEKNFEKAFELYTKAAEMNHSLAINNLGVCYEHGKGCIKDPKKSFELYSTASDMNEIGAIYNLAICYKFGTGCKKDFNRAFELYSKAAEMNHVSAINNLGYCYQFGEGCEIDYYKAFELYSKAVDMKDSAARSNLAFLYENGIGCKKNLDKALMLRKN